jgi:integrase
MGIKGFTGYSFRAATIQALFDAGLSEHEVNAYTGHSNRSHTAVTFYYHLDKAWAGDKIRFAPSDRIPLREEARKAIQADDSEEQ